MRVAMQGSTQAGIRKSQGKNFSASLQLLKKYTDYTN